MKIEVLEMSDRFAKFVLSDASIAFANGLRRAMLAEVPTLAITEVNLYNNTSVLYDEQLGLRLSLIPIKANTDELVPKEECMCDDNCPACEVSMTLSAEGPKMVYSGDFVSSDPEIFPSDENIPIVELKDGQQLFLEALAHVGHGKNHSRWQAGIACGYKTYPVVTFNNCDKCRSCIEACPKDIIQMGPSGAEIQDNDMLECTLCRSCADVCGINAITVDQDERAFIFNVESDGSYSAEELIQQASKALKKKSDGMLEVLEHF